MKALKSKLQSGFSFILSLFYPPRCPVCNTVTASRLYGVLCDSCRSYFESEFLSLCPKCGHKPQQCLCVPDTVGNDSDRSPYTTVTPLVFSGFYTGYDRESVVSKLVYSLKRQRLSDASYLFARIISQSLSQALVLLKIDLSSIIITYIPRSEQSVAEYGFDHMKRVAKLVSYMLGCGCEPLLLRCGGTAQKALGARERAANAYSTIFINQKKAKLIKGARIVILDDIITTGATMRATVSRLSLAGADTVIPVCAMVSRTGTRAKST